MSSGRYLSIMSIAIDTIQRFIQDILGSKYVVDWPPNHLNSRPNLMSINKPHQADSAYYFDIIEASTYFFICMIRVEEYKIHIIDHSAVFEVRYKTDEFEYADPRYDPNELLRKIKAIRDKNYANFLNCI